MQVASKRKETKSIFISLVHLIFAMHVKMPVGNMAKPKGLNHTDYLFVKNAKVYNGYIIQY